MTDHVIPGDLTHRARVITGLRQLADYLTSHPDVPVAPFGWDLNVYATRRDTAAAQRAEVDRIADILGAPVTDRTATGGHYTTGRSFGLVTYRAVHIPPRCRAAYDALMSYQDCVTPDQAEVTS